MGTPADEYARQRDLEPLAALDGFFALMDAGHLFEATAPDTLQAIRHHVYLALKTLLVWQRPVLEAERGLAWPYEAFERRVAFLEACVRQPVNPRLRREALLFLALLPFPRQWQWLSKALSDLGSHPEIVAFLDRERQKIKAKLTAKPLRRYRLRHFCQVLKKPRLPDEKGVLRIFALPYALLDSGLLRALNHKYVLYVEPAAGLIFRHPWYRAFSVFPDLCLLGMGGTEDRRFLAGQPGIETIALAHGDFLEAGGALPVRPKTYDLVFNATYDEMERKRHEFLLELLGHPRLRGLTALCVGRGSQTNVDRFQNRVRRQGLADRVTVLANLPRSTVPELLGQCRIGVHLALHENVCRCIYEFFRADLPCVISACTGGVNLDLFTPQTGRAVPDRELPAVIAQTLDQRERFAPRRWFLAHSGTHHSSRTLNARLQDLFHRRGYAWREDIVPLGSGGVNRYLSPDDYARFAPQFQELFDFFRRQPQFPLQLESE